jgi:hypothetical protein
MSKCKLNRIKLLPILLLLGFAPAPSAVAASTTQQNARTILGPRLCEGLVAKMEGDNQSPFIFRSFDQVPEGKPVDPMLSNAGFTYDNALATIALFACGRKAEAKRVADALALAVDKDRSYHDGRVRNAYRSGPVAIGREGMLLPGYWNSASNTWIEDQYQVSSGTGNLAWASLALLAAYDRTGVGSYLSAAKQIMHWIAADMKGAGALGYFGGTFGHESSLAKLSWKSTEQNLDVYAAASWLATEDKDETWPAMRDRTHRFLDAMWDQRQSRFFVGSLPGGDEPNTTQSGIDSELWPVMAVPEYRGRYDAILEWVGRRYSVGSGFDFNDDRDGIWLEGTAQAALAFRLAGKDGKSDALLDTIGGQIASDGLVFATVGPELTTGLKIGPDQASADFKYYRMPHVGATAWAILAALDYNPFRPFGRALPAPGSENG